MKRIITFALALMMMLITSLSVSAATPGMLAGNYYYTDIVTYLNGTSVNTINIGGVTLIDAESMSHYGYTVIWRDNERWLEIVDRRTGEISPEAANGSLLDMSTGCPGSVAGRYFHTDIRTTLNGERIISYNIGGKTFIGAEAMRDFGYDVLWDSNARTLSIGMDYLRPTWMWEYIDGTGTALNNGLVLEFVNITQNEKVEFHITIASGEYSSVGRLVFSDKSITMTIYIDVKDYGDFWQILTANRNIIYGERVHEDTLERRSELTRVFRVYSNGVALGGEMAYYQGNGSASYNFIYDIPLSLADIETVRLEVGYNE